MGKYVTTVGTTVSRVVADEFLPNSVKQAVFNALHKGTELSDTVTATLGDGIAIRANRIHRMAKRGYYYHGLPHGDIYTPMAAGKLLVKEVLETLEGAEVFIEYLHYGPPNNLHYGWTQLFEEHGYDISTNLLGDLSTTKNTPVYLDDMVLVVPNVENLEPRSLAQWGWAPRAGVTPERLGFTTAVRELIRPSAVVIADALTEEHLLVKYVWEEELVADEEIDGVMVLAGTTVLRRDSFNIPLTGVDDNMSYYHVCYRTVDLASPRKYWMYEDGSGLHEDLDTLFDGEWKNNGTFFPFIYFRYNKTSELSNPGHPAVADSIKMCEILGMDYEKLAQSIDENPDIADVEHALMMMAVPANTENEVERRYLFDFFTLLYEKPEPEFREVHEDRATVRQFIAEFSGFSQGIAIQDKRFKMWLDNSGIYKRRVAGTFGAVGSHDSGFVSREKALSGIDATTGDPSTVVMTDKYHYFRRQVSTGFYEEIRVVNLQTIFQVAGSHRTLGDEEDTILIIPIDRQICSLYSMPVREELYARSLHYVFNSLVVTKLKWYQTGVFKALLLIVAVVVIALSYGTMTSEAIALVQAGSYAAAAYLVLTIVVQQIVVSFLFRLLVKAVGTEAALILAVIAAVAGVVDGVNAESLTGAPFAKDLLFLATNMAKTVQSEVASDFRDLAAEYESTEKLQNEQQKLLDQGWDLLDTNNFLSPFTIFGETPQEMYSRTVHSGNIGVMSIEAISGFVDMKLTLPRINETLGGVKYE